MPIYEFACTECDHKFDVFGRYESREETQICPSCESTRTHALFSTFAKGGSATEAAIPSSGGGCGGCGGGCSCSN